MRRIADLTGFTEGQIWTLGLGLLLAVILLLSSLGAIR